jgi:hypothetical protein
MGEKTSPRPTNMAKYYLIIGSCNKTTPMCMHPNGFNTFEECLKSLTDVASDPVQENEFFWEEYDGKYDDGVFQKYDKTSGNLFLTKDLEEECFSKYFISYDDYVKITHMKKKWCINREICGRSCGAEVVIVRIDDGDYNDAEEIAREDAFLCC